MRKIWVTYGFAIGLLFIASWWILQQGRLLETDADLLNGLSNSAQSIWQPIIEGFSHPLSIFLLQILIIIALARLLGWVVGKMGQPTVVGEIIAGILLGPSLLGWIAPDFFGFLYLINRLLIYFFKE